MSNQKLYSVVKKVISTEKATSASSSGVFTVKVDARSNKALVKMAFESIYGVKVISVNLLNTKGKDKKFKGTKGHVSGFKKAFVRLAGQQQVDFTKVS